ncbi:uncharacterized protein, partial [Montipora foliosa]|uniref:uncharacterized protein n=1 Tax=Montipora foliosa TaxID=591990 RepID=UPI0035F1C1BD
CPVGHNMLGETVKRLCKGPGIEGQFTNRSPCNDSREFKKPRRLRPRKLPISNIGDKQLLSHGSHRSHGLQPWLAGSHIVLTPRGLKKGIPDKNVIERTGHREVRSLLISYPDLTLSLEM